MGTVSTTFAPSIQTPARNFNVWAKIAETLKIWQQHRRELAELTAMSDYQLKDIGVTRNDLYREFYKPSSRA
jgi:uncharacterized protein YjiS (DUF1127 family)